MNDIEKKALALLNEVWAERGRNVTLDRFSRDDFTISEALCRAIEQHEAFRQEVSRAIYVDVVAQVRHGVDAKFRTNSVGFIIPEPADPLAECLLELDLSENDEQARHDAEWLVKTLAKRGGKIVWENSDA